ncbi:tetraacyldisaccharide 4'-kinase [Mannheimia sp. AT1]|uniref:Tetraacyldisaccharide 4'-kinase n=1 Tax=Mannheimia cairinae TaxID=3025936 RepID=A0ABT5MNJ7_9PAST|nr:tetraacyldisaccharide 4'-kinase [Mannheimia cairinae]MDD0823577.1 tetraacyldisaccharide 4'-kinase [Mannheimia cairinae]MDD0826790.1 tetraacyldisaccharide 4'-kinase [Mannheimia cairinae]
MKLWQTKSWLTWLLSPLSFLFLLVTKIRHWLYQKNILKSYRAPVPVLIVGNLSVGGNGKTPVVIWLVEQLQKKGIKVGVISRGYGGKNKQYPQLVTQTSSAEIMGDEPVLIVQRTNVPLAISPNRQQSIELLLNQFELDLIISDDGLQHYALQRDIEWVVVDGIRRFGNNFLLPAGGLRELPSRLKSVDAIICNGGIPKVDEHLMKLEPSFAVNLLTNERKAIQEFTQSCVAIAGIGHPARFFTMLETLKISLIKTQAFADHQAFNITQLKDLADTQTPLLMTEKDAVKCRDFAQHNWWYIPVSAKFSEESTACLLNSIQRKLKNS